MVIDSKFSSHQRTLTNIFDYRIIYTQRKEKSQSFGNNGGKVRSDILRLNSDLIILEETTNKLKLGALLSKSKLIKLLYVFLAL